MEGAGSADGQPPASLSRTSGTEEPEAAAVKRELSGRCCFSPKVGGEGEVFLVFSEWSRRLRRGCVRKASSAEKVCWWQEVGVCVLCVVLCVCVCVCDCKRGI